MTTNDGWIIIAIEDNANIHKKEEKKFAFDEHILEICGNMT